ncbi:NACHT and WD repeat domain-containing protein 2 [Amphibalanus amphitrite]|uniref:NACHT and WD repeat domain-containing protein 2 n=1 Tax=Amphibalanus amphitrite TaxID=1232801 RepID=A0A6A4XFI1_AMPAM|nr:NACHT and WD repeat domain-containing protein 2-like isoform X2 [Amphibalanus amphitrite]KAF0313272.1 NACHT and WD repeat domain-containing protein 2 [Amphibalanus amphitrite]
MGTSCSTTSTASDESINKYGDRAAAEKAAREGPPADSPPYTPSSLHSWGSGSAVGTEHPMSTVGQRQVDTVDTEHQDNSMRVPAPTQQAVSKSSSSTDQPLLDPGLPDLSKLSELVRSLVTGDINYVKPILKPRKICIYTCGDLQDTIMERSSLMDYVYPKLRMYCIERGYELNVIDLHWGLPDEHLNDHSLKELCLNELKSHAKDSHVVTIVFLNDTFGNPLLPRCIEGPDFDQAVSRIEDEKDRELLWTWYQWDENASPPCYRLAPISTQIPDIKEMTAEKRADAIKEWRHIVKEMMNTMRKAFNQEQKEKYLTSVMEQEIKQAVFLNQQSAKRCLWLCRRFTHFPSHNVPEDAKSYISTEPESKKRLDILKSELKERLDETRMLKFMVKWHTGGMDVKHSEHKQFVEDLCAQFSPLIISVIDNVLSEDESKLSHIQEELKTYLGVEKRLFHELMQQSLACKNRFSRFHGRPEMLVKIRRYLNNDSCVPLILHGRAGCGKSSLVAKVAEQCGNWLNNPQLSVRFIGLTPDSSTTELVLRSIAEQCCVLYGEHSATVSKGIGDLNTYLARVLSKASAARPLVVIIDGLDQVRSYSTRKMDWVPKELPEHTKLILTMADDCEEFADLEKKIDDKSCFLKVGPLTTEEATNILDNILKDNNRKINKGQREVVNRYIAECPLPLYVEAVGMTTCNWTGGEEHLALRSTLVEQIHVVLDELEREVGAVPVSRILGYLTAARQGLSDSEIMDLLSCDEEVLNEIFVYNTPPVRRCPSILWTQISSRLSPFLMKTIVSGLCLTTWKDNTFSKVARERYFKQEQQFTPCMALFDYFTGKWANGRKKPVLLPNGEQAMDADGQPLELERFIMDQPIRYRSRYNRRRLDELPYQVFQLTGNILDDFVLNNEWVYDKLCGSTAYQVLEDVSLAMSKDPDNKELQLFRELLELSSYALGCDGRQFYTQFYGRLMQFMKEEENQKQYPLMKAIHDKAFSAPEPSLIPLGFILQEPGQAEPPVNDNVYFNQLYRAKQNPHHVITVSHTRGEIAVWNIYTMQAVRTLKGIHQPQSLKMIDEYRCLVLSGRELKIYNFDEGLFVMKLKQIMNQKMPYYGLHNQDHVVALSRDRMYVNMMNLQNGDCVATFKVGEDRFLNSLIVSDDGRICVCGDETQKPFPLLVWDLQSRKLMYDLRIPHHEFVTRLAAITSEGHYVCCGCREVDEPSSPTFVVVYDLQSGTLFKKCKLGVNVVSMAISSQSSCIVVGLEDCMVVVIDLISGNTRWNLKGHTAPPDAIRFDNRGHKFLTFDSEGRDRSVRVWELMTGNSLGVFTPDQTITACDLSGDGRAVIFALKGRSHIVTLALCHGQGLELPQVKQYGSEQNQGKTFDLSQAGTWTNNDKSLWGN